MKRTLKEVCKLKKPQADTDYLNEYFLVVRLIGKRQKIGEHIAQIPHFLSLSLGEINPYYNIVEVFITKQILKPKGVIS